MVDKLTLFIKNELIYFINQEINKGLSIQEIKDSLIKAGHHRDMIKEVIHILKKNNFDIDKALIHPISRDYLNEQSYYDILNALITYIEFQLDNKMNFKKIQEILIDYGNSKLAIKEAFNEVKRKKKEKAKNKIVPLLILSWLAILFLLTSTTQEVFILIFLGLVPSLISLLIAQSIKTKKSLNLFIPPIVVIVIFAIIGSFIPAYQNMQLQNLAILNLLLSLIYSMILTYFVVPPIKKTKEEEKEEENIENKLKPMLEPLD